MIKRHSPKSEMKYKINKPMSDMRSEVTSHQPIQWFVLFCQIGILLWTIWILYNIFILDIFNKACHNNHVQWLQWRLWLFMNRSNCSFQPNEYENQKKKKMPVNNGSNFELLKGYNIIRNSNIFFFQYFKMQWLRKRLFLVQSIGTQLLWTENCANFI